MRLSRIIACIITCLLSCSLQAHPDEPTETEATTVFSEAREDGSLVFFAKNPLVIPVWIQVAFSEMSNLVSPQTLPFEGPVPEESTKFELFTLTKANQSLGYSYRLTIKTLYSKPQSDYASTHTYLLPFEHGKKYKLSQGFNGKSTHSGANTFAIDFEMDTGTAIHAARGGTVFYIKEDSNVGGFSSRYSDHTNLIKIMHDDGSVGNYAHLMYNGAIVDIGDTVAAGALIGFSGNTGVSSGPHLHFDVRIPRTDTFEMYSTPFTILTHTGETATPEEGIYYYAFHPGNPPFEATLGTDLKNEDFDGYIRSTNASNVSIREERVDDTSILYIYNGLSRDISSTVTLSLQNMVASTATTLTIDIPAKTEYFLSLLRPTPGSTQYRYSTQLRY